jgi:O-antigen/teichoic acid export membrane protein
MNKRKLIKNFSYVFFSNGMSMSLSAVMGIVLPILFGSDFESYGYVQLYFLFVGYYYIFDLGLCSGIYLREGGKEYKELDKGSYSAQFLFLAVSQLVIAFCIAGFALLFIGDDNRKYIYIFVAVNIVIMQLRTMITELFQAINFMKEYSFIIMIGKFLNILVIFFAVVLGIRQYKSIILFFTICELISLIYAIIKCKNIIFSKPKGLSRVKNEIIENIKAGINMMLSGMSSMLMTGIIRISIEKQWNIETFAKVSVTLNISNMLMVFISAVSVVLYPEIKRIDKYKYLPIYNKMRAILMTFILGAICFYYPIRLLLMNLIPQYKESLIYAAILLPVCIYSSNMSMLIQTFMKVLRLEKKILLTNFVGFLSAVILTLVSVFWVKNINLAVVSVLLCQTSPVFRGHSTASISYNGMCNDNLYLSVY